MAKPSVLEKWVPAGDNLGPKMQNPNNGVIPRERTNGLLLSELTDRFLPVFSFEAVGRSYGSMVLRRMLRGGQGLAGNVRTGQRWEGDPVR